ncbi:unnamed protein product [Camellia sinensis]
MMRNFKEFFGMTVEDKESMVNKSGLIYTSSTGYAKDGVHLWRENLKQPCHPLEKCIQLSPKKPTIYREVVSKYLVEVKELSLRILELISRGLGLEPGFFKESSQLQLMLANYYPPCPDPSLTLGILRHCDPSIITILLQDVPGLQVVKDGQWVGVDALPSAFVVNIGNQLERTSMYCTTFCLHQMGALNDHLLPFNEEPSVNDSTLKSKGSTSSADRRNNQIKWNLQAVTFKCWG